MNTNQIMPMQGDMRVSRKAQALSSARGGKDGAFNDVLAKSKGDSLTLQDVKDLAKSAETAKEETTLKNAVEEAGTDATTPIKTNNDNKSETKETTSAKGENTPQEPLNEEAAIKAGAAVLALISQVVDGNNQAVADVNPQESKNLVNLQSILPQSGEIMNKNQEMLAMLSGAHIPNKEPAFDFQGLKPANVNSLNLVNLNVVNVNLNSSDLSGLNLADLDLGNLDLSNLDLGNLDLSKFDLSKLNLSDLDLSKLDLKNLDFTNLENLSKSVKETLKTIGEAALRPEQMAIPADIKVEPQTLGFADPKNFVPAEHFSNAKVIDNANAVINNIGAKDINPEAVGAKGPVADAKNIEIKAQPVLANTQAPKAAENVNQTPIDKMAFDAKEDDIFSQGRIFNNFDQKSDNRQGQFFFGNNAKDNFFENENAPKTDVPRAETNSQFAHALETQNSGQTSTVRESAPTAPLPRDDYNVREQIVQQARLIRAENGSEMVIRLRPEHLGDMTLRISVSSEGAVTASFFTNNAEVRHIVENSLAQLRQELQNQGIKVDKTEVYSGLSDGNLPQGQGQEAWQQNQRGNSAPSRFISNENGAVEFEEGAAAVQATSETALSDTGVDYLV